MMAPGMDKASPSTRNETNDVTMELSRVLKTTTFVQTSLNWARVKEEPDGRCIYRIN